MKCNEQKKVGNSQKNEWSVYKQRDFCFGNVYKNNIIIKVYCSVEWWRKKCMGNNIWFVLRI